MTTQEKIERDLYEVRIALASRYKLIRVRATNAEDAYAIILGHHPGWDHVETTRRVGESWVPV